MWEITELWCRQQTNLPALKDSQKLRVCEKVKKKRNVQLVHGTFFINSHESQGVVGVHHGCFGLIAGLRPGPWCTSRGNLFKAKQSKVSWLVVVVVVFLRETNIVAKGQRDTKAVNLNNILCCCPGVSWGYRWENRVLRVSFVQLCGPRLCGFPERVVRVTWRTGEKNRQQIWRWQLVPERRPSRHGFLLFMPLWSSSCRQCARAGNFYIPRRKSHNTCLPLWLSLVTAEPSASASCNISSWLLHPDGVLWILSDYMYLTLVQYQPLKCPALQGTLLECHLAVAVLFKLYSNVGVDVGRQFVHPRLRQLQE